MEKLKKILERNISGKKVLGLFILTNVVYIFMLTITIPTTMNHSNGLKLLDMMPTGYDLSYVTKLFNSLGKIGREIYLTNQIPVDMIYPLFFGLSYCLLLAYFLEKLKKLKPPYIYLCFLPIIAGIADYFENFGIIAMLKNYPDVTQGTVSLISLFSIIKSISTTIFFVTLIIILILLGIRTLSRKRTHYNNGYK